MFKHIDYIASRAYNNYIDKLGGKIKKIIVFSFLFLLSSLVLSPTKALAGPSIDQSYVGGDSPLILDASSVAQTFMPSVTGLSYVEIELGTEGTGQEVAVAIRHKTGSTWDAGRLAFVKQPAISGWNTFDFTDITVTKDDLYGIFVTGTAPTGWIYSDQEGTYSRGNVYLPFNDMNMPNGDLNFKTWGTSPVEMIDEQDISEQQNSTPETVEVSADQTAGTGDAPAAVTSNTIEAPSGLKTKYINGTVSLSWVASKTTNIDGYKVFRSEEKTTAFKEIGKTSKANVEYSDKNNLISQKTYYYFVRAYKGTEESSATQTIEITTSETVSAAVGAKAEATPSFDNETDTADQSQGRLYWIFPTILLILLVILIAYKKRLKIKEFLKKRFNR